MQANPTPAPAFDASILDQLACPACLGDLRLDGQRLVCAACGRIYPIVDGIPVLIVDMAIGEDRSE
ncbi:MAG TPA: Trm112 family protein [Dongiaceae bacterium]|nr:Trm112 family protein [Dongiaceae bacterium]HXR39714.1 Trm112 family protein [Terracidiphilus sp.]